MKRRIMLFMKQFFKKGSEASDPQAKKSHKGLLIAAIIAAILFLPHVISVGRGLFMTVYALDKKGSYKEMNYVPETLPADYIPETIAPRPVTETEIMVQVEDVPKKGSLEEHKTVPEVPQPQIVESSEEAPKEVTFSYEQLTVKGVCDGDTIIVFNPETHSEFKVRLILVDTPESVASEDYEKVSGKTNSIYGVMASDYTKSRLKPGTTVYATNDSVFFDKYDRRLCYIWTELPSDIEDENEIREKCFNAELLREGYGTILKIDNDKYYELFCNLEAEAISDRRGLWADNSYRQAMGLE